MTKLLSIKNFGLISLTSLGLGLAAAACGGGDDTPSNTGGAGGAGAVGGSTGGTGGSTGGAGGATGGAGGAATGGTGGGTTGGTGGGTTGGAGGAVATGGSAGVPGAGGGGGLPGAGGGGGVPSAGGASGMGGTDAGGMSGGAGMSGSGGMAVVELPPLVTSGNGAYWKTDVMPTDSTASATVTVNDTMVITAKWEGFGGAFNELGWKYLNSAALQMEAIKLLFSATDGANFAWGRIPMGASDYAESRYTLTDTEDPVAMSGDSNRPAQGTFSLTRDEGKLIPYILAAKALKPELRFWASPWTPPLWMKTGYKTNGGDGSATAKRASYYDGGTMKSDTAVLTAFADYFKQFVEGYKAKGINIEIVSAQNEPGYDQNYPSCLWDGTTYTTFIKTYLGPAMQELGVKIMLGTMSNSGDNGRDDNMIAQAVLADTTAKGFLAVAGAQWGVLADVVGGTASFGGLPIWASEHKCGNYPWNPSDAPAYNSSQAPNDQAYGVESWKYIRDAINKGKVSSYNAWNMVLDKNGLGIDTTREWKQNALLVVDGGMIKPTPAYYVFRHMSQYAAPNAQVVGTSGGDAIAFKNPDGSLVAVMYNSGAANPNYVVAIGGKKLQFAMPADGWATVKVKP
jgi:glucosylceramidase